MPPFDLQDLAGKRVTAASLEGKPTLISFFFSHLRALHSRGGADQPFRRERVRR